LDLALRMMIWRRRAEPTPQNFRPTRPAAFTSRHSPAYWDLSKESTRSQFELFSKYDGFGPEQYEALARHCQDIGSTSSRLHLIPGAVEFLEPLVPFYKIASADITNVPMLRQVAAKGKPVVLSTGASTLAEIDMASATLMAAGCRDLVLMHCVLNYPCPNRNAHLNMIEGLMRVYPDRLIGYSDHTLPDERMLILTAAWLKGAVVLEKHFTHDKTLPAMITTTRWMSLISRSFRRTCRCCRRS